MISQNQLDRLKTGLSVTRSLSNGKWVVSNCPKCFSQNKDGSQIVLYESGVVSCVFCGENLSPGETAVLLGLTDFSERSSSLTYFEKLVHVVKVESGKFHRLSEKVISEFQIKLLPRLWEKSDKSGYSDKIALPDESGEPSRFLHKPKDGKWTWVSPNNKQEISKKKPKAYFSNFHRVSDETPIYVLAGEWDLFTFWEKTGIHGISPRYGEGFKKDLAADPVFKNFEGREIVLILDPDRTGRKGMSDLANFIFANCRPGSVKTVDISPLMPEIEGQATGKDIDDFFNVRGGTWESLKRHIDETKPIETKQPEPLEIPERPDGLACPLTGADFDQPDEIIETLWKIAGLRTEFLQESKISELAESVDPENGKSLKRQFTKILDNLKTAAAENRVSEIANEKLFTADAGTMKGEPDVYFYNPQTGIYEICPGSEKEVLAGKITDQVFKGHDLSKQNGKFTRIKTKLAAAMVERNATFNQARGKIVLKNGILDVKTGQLSPFTPNHFSTIRVNLAFDENANCPKWKEFLEYALPDTKDRQELGKLFLQTLTGEISDRKTPFAYGITGSGKSTIFEVLARLVGAENVSRISAERLIRDRFAIAETRGKLLNIAGETPEDLPLDDSFKLLNEKEITAARKHKDDVTFQNNCRFVFIGNNLPRLKDLSAAIESRLLPFVFENQISEQTRKSDFLEILETELSGILNWALSHREAWEKDKGFIQRETAFKFLAETRTESDSVSGFMSDLIFSDEQKEEKLKTFSGLDRKKYFFEILQTAERQSGSLLVSTDKFGQYIDQVSIYSEYKDFCESENRKAVSRQSFSARVRQYLAANGLSELAELTVKRVRVPGENKRAYRLYIVPRGKNNLKVLKNEPENGEIVPMSKWKRQEMNSSELENTLLNF